MIAAGCPFDYEDGELITRSSVNIFALQIYAVDDSLALTNRMAEHWLPPGTHDATPVTHIIEVPVNLFGTEQLAEYLDQAIGPELTRRRWRLAQP